LLLLRLVGVPYLLYLYKIQQLRNNNTDTNLVVVHSLYFPVTRHLRSSLPPVLHVYVPPGAPVLRDPFSVHFKQRPPPAKKETY
jgi:hypothetical protein